MTASRFMDARNVAHHAAQSVSAWGATHLETDPNHDYANLGWHRKLEVDPSAPTDPIECSEGLSLVGEVRVVDRDPVDLAVTGHDAGGVAFLEATVENATVTDVVPADAVVSSETRFGNPATVVSLTVSRDTPRTGQILGFTVDAHEARLGLAGPGTFMISATVRDYNGNVTHTVRPVTGTLEAPCAN